MSYVCDTILHFSILEDAEEIMDQVNGFFKEGKSGFVLMDDESLPKDAKYWYGGSKAFQSPIAIGAFNYLDLKGLIKHLKWNVKWKHYESVQLIWKNEDDEYFQCRFLNTLDETKEDGKF